jgi:hypothetical protein
MPFLYDYWLTGSGGGTFFHDQIPAHHFVDLPTSSAPIGAYSSNQYAGNTSSTSLQIGNGQGGADNISATINAGTADGIHVYGEDAWPNTVNGISDTIPGSKRYAGVYMVNSNAASYTLQYDYTNNPFVNAINEPYLWLRKRDNNSVGTWTTPASLVLDQVLNNLTCTGQNTEYILAKGLTLLPLKWQSFTAQLNSSKQTLLNWKVTAEQNIHRYEVEWSVDAIHFSTIETINYNNLLLGNYKTVHFSPSVGINYYRIKQFDIDGQFTYSNIQFVKVVGANEFSIYPNPASEIVNILGWNNIKKIHLFDIGGRLIKEWLLTPQNIDVSNLLNGTYILKVELKTGETLKQKLIVSK